MHQDLPLELTALSSMRLLARNRANPNTLRCSLKQQRQHREFPHSLPSSCCSSKLFINNCSQSLALEHSSVLAFKDSIQLLQRGQLDFPSLKSKSGRKDAPGKTEASGETTFAGQSLGLCPGQETCQLLNALSKQLPKMSKFCYIHYLVVVSAPQQMPL